MLERPMLLLNTKMASVCHMRQLMIYGHCILRRKRGRSIPPEVWDIIRGQACQGEESQQPHEFCLVRPVKIKCLDGHRNATSPLRKWKRIRCVRMEMESTDENFDFGKLHDKEQMDALEAFLDVPESLHKNSLRIKVRTYEWNSGPDECVLTFRPMSGPQHMFDVIVGP